MWKLKEILPPPPSCSPLSLSLSVQREGRAELVVMSVLLNKVVSALSPLIINQADFGAKANLMTLASGGGRGVSHKNTYETITLYITHF